MVTIIFLLSLGLLLLYFGAEFLVRGSSSLALRFGLKPLLVGLTVVAFGTSSPELVVSVKAALNGSPDLTVGNVIGSNIFNTFFILGLAAAIRPLAIHVSLLKWDAPVALLSSLLLVLMLVNGKISTFEGVVLVFLIIAYITINVIMASKEKSPEIAREFGEALDQREKNFFLLLFFIIAGIFGLVYGADLFVRGAIRAARLLNVSEAVIGITVVGAGTSLPELATSLVAAIKKQGDISVGNIIGSNIFNILSILGISAIIRPIYTADITLFDLGTLVFSAFIILPLMKSRWVLEKKEGLLLVLFFLIYMAVILH